MWWRPTCTIRRTTTCCGIAPANVSRSPNSCLSPAGASTPTGNAGSRGLMRQVGKTTRSGGPNKARRLKKATRAYLKKARALEGKVTAAIATHSPSAPADVARMDGLRYYQEMLIKHIDLVDRRLIAGEQIPHQENSSRSFSPGRS
ncbi:MAG: hypothetical protein U5K69_09930 [Balneolaceae bacterium]|nr:hypothetical protein [Balneolaceae bacterium]